MKYKTCCFTGHRQIAAIDIPFILEKTQYYIHTLANQGVSYFSVGGALGFDTLAAEMLFQLRDSSLPHISIILIYPFDGYITCWNDTQKEKHKSLLPLYDKIICVSNECSRNAYLARNRYLVDHASHCICYCNRHWSGTAYTVKYARQKNLNIYNTGSFDIKTL